MTSLAALARVARPEALALARLVLEQDAADQAWGSQVGPALTQRDTATLLGKTEQAVAKDGRLLRVRDRSSRPVYPVVQFSGRQQRVGVSEVVHTLTEALEPLSIASWLTAPNRALDGARPVDLLPDGRVLVIARDLARSAA